MSVWHGWWQGRALRAEADADLMGNHLRNLLDSWGPSIAEWTVGRETLQDWVVNHGSRSGHGGAGYWSERAQVAEQDADRLAQVLQAIDGHHNLSYSQWAPLRALVRDYVTHREERYGALPTGPTRIGNLTSGGVQV